MLNDRFTKLEIQKLSLSCARMTSFSKTCFLRSKANMRGGGGGGGGGGGERRRERVIFFYSTSGTREQISLPLRHSMVMYGR